MHTFASRAHNKIARTVRGGGGGGEGRRACNFICVARCRHRISNVLKIKLWSRAAYGLRCAVTNWPAKTGKIIIMGACLPALSCEIEIAERAYRVLPSQRRLNRGQGSEIASDRYYKAYREEISLD